MSTSTKRTVQKNPTETKRKSINKPLDQSIKKRVTEKRIESLAEIIRYHQEQYYNKTPKITDEEFDALWDRLRRIAPEHPLIHTLGEDQSTLFSKVKHIMPMGSLDKLHTEDEIYEWVSAYHSDEYIVEHKLDGASIELQYRDGRLLHAVTRGNGKIGDDIRINARQMQGVFTQINPTKYQTHLTEISRDIAIRGEVVITKDVFETHFSDSKANPRNTANGIMKRKDGEFNHLLMVCCYDIWIPNANKEYTELEKLTLLSSLGFLCVKYHVCTTAEQIVQTRRHIIDKRNMYPIEIDGIVLKSKTAITQDMQSLKPKLQIAVKFPLERVITKLLDIHWSSSGHNYTPVAVLEPVKIAGTTVKRANLVHLEEIQTMGLRIGSEVQVVKRGEIIPKVEKCIYTPPDAQAIVVPKVCETCSEKLVIEALRVYCPNINCKKRILYRIQKWFASLEIDNWGYETLSKLVLDYEIVHRIGDLYRLKVEDLQKLPKFGDVLAKKLLTSLHAKKEIEFTQLVAGLGIEGISTLTAEQLVKHGFHSWQQLRQASVKEIMSIENFAEKTSKKLQEMCAFFDEEVMDLMKFVLIKKPTMRIDNGVLSGKRFCITGEHTKPRKDLVQLIQDNGGIFDATVKKSTMYLLVNDVHTQSSKAKKARAQGIHLISEDDLYSMITNK